MRKAGYPRPIINHCPPATTGTMAGFAWHRSHNFDICAPCHWARAAYIEDLQLLWAPEAANPAQARVRSFIEDYLYLITTGETHGETIARRLGTNQFALERRLFRHGLHPLHTTRGERPAAIQNPATVAA